MPEHLSYREARERVLGAVRPLAAVEVPLEEAFGRPLRRTVTAPHPLPPFANSSMDGWAMRAADLEGAAPDRPAILPVGLVIPAGTVAGRGLAAGEAARIMTGAALPEGADCVVPFEDGERLGGDGAPERVRVSRPAAPGDFVRPAGADLAAGACALEDGRELSAHDLALLAALGVGRVSVGPRPRAAVLSTGDELLEVEDALRPGAIRDSNRPLLSALLREVGAVLLRATRLPDDTAKVAAAIRGALEIADVVITVGGVSAGDFDPVRRAVEDLEGLAAWRVAMKPGRPQAFGAPGGRLFFGLPGNPASVACVWEALVRPAVLALQGHAALDRPRVSARLDAPVASRPGRTDFVRATLEWRDEGWWARPAGNQASGHLTPQSRAHALLVIPEEVAGLSPGDRAEAWVLRLPVTPAPGPRSE